MSVENLKVIAIIPSAGSGERCGVSSDNMPKQFSIVCDQPLIYHTLQAFCRIKCIHAIIVVTSTHHSTQMNGIISSLGLESRIYCVSGGNSRHRSIYAGIQAITQTNISPDIVVIHDGVRPLINQEFLIEIICNAYKHGACGVICKLTSTVLNISEDQFLDCALDRSKYYASEMPQAFRYELIKRAYDRCSAYDFDYNTECLDLVQRYASSKVKLLRGNESEMWKVTYKKDLYSADAILKEKRNILFYYATETSCSKYIVFIQQIIEDLRDSFENFIDYTNTSLSFKPNSITIYLKICRNWSEILEFDFNKCEPLIILVLDETDTTLSIKQMNEFVKNKFKGIKQFYIIHCSPNNLESNAKQIINTTIYIAKQSPIEISGQIFFY